MGRRPLTNTPSSGTTECTIGRDATRPTRGHVKAWEVRVMAQRVAYPEHIEPLVQFVEETPPERIVAATHDKLAAGTPVKDMLLASALAVVRSSDLPPGHHGGPLHPLAGLHAVRHTAARLPGDYARLPLIHKLAVANKHIHSPAMGPFILAE